MKSVFSGIIPPVVTPLLSAEELDAAAVDRVVDHMIDGGVSGLFLLGTTGEGPSLMYQVRYEMVEQACRKADGRVPSLVCVTDCSMGEAIALAEHSAEHGAAAIVSAAPYYFDVTQKHLAAWFRELADRSPLPLMLYNMPSCVGVNLDLDTVIELSDHENIIGIKDSGGDLAAFQKMAARFNGRQDFVTFIGSEELLPSAVAAGGAGGVTGGGNLLPQLYSDLYSASVENNSSRIAELRVLMERVFQTVYRDPSGKMNIIPALKYALSLCGLCNSQTAPPLLPLAEDHAAQIRNGLPGLLQAAGSPLECSVP
jgi:4-hydroxy-tetrahydrodipicolinate synthase